MGDSKRDGKGAAKRVEKSFNCGPIGPGPIYKLPPVVGYPGHDITKYRNPAYSMARRTNAGRPKTRTGVKADTGNLYNLGKVNRYGKFYSPAFSLLQRIPGKVLGIGPGPAAYDTQNIKDLSRPTPPAASIKSRPKSIYKNIGPGPGAYNPKPPPTKSVKMTFRHPEKMNLVGPGPGAYGAPDMNKVRKKPQYAKILSRPQQTKAPVGPGPAYYPKNLGRRVPAFSFGTKHSECAGTYTQPDDLSTDTLC
ncbi:outer dense fiber protein 3-like protein 2 [Cimex lectularius]|uniref:Outer dense fiber protein 3 n=1 Tax=Cimex lectularius TaxID=79782 RepID=A0A8I6SR55_CIMLE|nr:outer dense fiber protein 3-like protein 2 [Cimex lectularius]